MLSLFLGFALPSTFIRACVCAYIDTLGVWVSTEVLACVTISALKQFTAPEGHIYVALYQFTS